MLPSRNASAAPDDHDGLVSEDELNYGEMDESDLSGSEFEASESDSEASAVETDENKVVEVKLTRRGTKRVVKATRVSSDDEEDEGDEEEDLALAMKLSRQDVIKQEIVVGSSASAGPSSAKKNGKKGVREMSPLTDLEDDEAELPKRRGKVSGSGKPLEIRHAEKELSRKLGRRLTWVSRSALCLSSLVRYTPLGREINYSTLQIPP